MIMGSPLTTYPPEKAPAPLKGMYADDADFGGGAAAAAAAAEEEPGFSLGWLSKANSSAVEWQETDLGLQA